MEAPSEILDLAYQRVSSNLNSVFITDHLIQARVEIVCRNIQNRAVVRLLLACLLAKIHRPEIDIRKPYTQIGDTDAFSGRTYDERYLTEFIIRHNLPCNPTTAFLTPALRNRNTLLTPELELEGRPREVYQAALQLLADVHENRATPEDLLAETIRLLLIVRDEKRQRMESLLAGLAATQSSIFYRLRMQFLDVYQALVLAEPDSAVSQPLKEAFLVLRQAAESGE
ncbi:MAG: hypothetical protein HZC41_26975 [Chloroflexi bacterium]|nr:hypothetical protein [Chloroflexota bacterium]